MRKKSVVPILLLALLLPTGVALAADGYGIPRHVIGGGGGHASHSPYSLDYTIGQPVTGEASQSPYELCAGFWCGMAGSPGFNYRVFLPVVLRNFD